MKLFKSATQGVDPNQLEVIYRVAIALGLILFIFLMIIFEVVFNILG